MPDNTAKIAAIRAALESGATTVTVDGTTTTLSPDSLRTELRRLMAEDTAQRAKRPVLASVDLSGF